MFSDAPYAGEIVIDIVPSIDYLAQISSINSRRLAQPNWRKLFQRVLHTLSDSEMLFIRPVVCVVDHAFSETVLVARI